MEGDLQQIVGRNMKAIRMRRGISQESLAEEFGFHRTYLASIERGERNLSLRSLERLAAMLSIDPLDLLRPLPGSKLRKLR